MIRTLTPNDIGILIHCHCCPEPHPRLSAPAVQETIARFLKEGLIEPLVYPAGYVDCYTTTERGKALMALLCCTPFPTKQWVDGNGQVIECL